MNLFASSPCPKTSAIVLDDSRVIKMCLETSQLLSTAVHNGLLTARGAVYKAAYIGHPITKWVSSDLRNAAWSRDHLGHLLAEYQRRFGRSHACTVIYESVQVPDITDLPDYFVNCTPHKEMPDVHDAYKHCLVDKWLADIRPPRWTNAQPPAWFQ